MRRPPAHPAVRACGAARTRPRYPFHLAPWSRRSPLGEPPGEAVRPLPRDAREPALLHGVERDQVDVAVDAAKPSRELDRVPLLGIHALGKRILEHHAPPRRLSIPPRGLDHARDAVRAVHRHQLVPDGVVWRVQRHAQRHMRRFPREPFHLLHKPAGRERDVARADVHAVLRAHEPEERQRIVVIVQRLAAAHQNDVCDGTLVPLLRQNVPPGAGDEAKHFARLEIPYAPVQRGGAERAAHFAADLRGNAQRVTVMIPHQHAFDKVSVLEFIEVFDRFVLQTYEFFVNPRAAEGQGGKLLPQRPGEVGHALRPLAAREPGKHLLRAKARLSEIMHERLERGDVHRHQARHGWPSLRTKAAM